MRFLKQNRIFFILLFATILANCSTNKLKSTGVKSYVYDTKIKDLNPNFLIYHQSDSLSYLYFKIQTKELLYTRENSTKPFESTVKIQYEIYETSRGKILIDSSSKELIDYKTVKGSKIIIGRIPLKIMQGNNSVMRVVVEDLNKKVEVDEVIRINKTEKKSSQYFLMKSNNQICFDTYFDENIRLEMESEMNKNSSMELQVFYRKDKPARPPFSRQNIFVFPDTADEFRPVSFVNGKAKFSLDSLASYFFKSRDSEKISFVLEKFNSNYNNIENYMGMIEPLKYISSTEEYLALQSANNKRKAIEDFWIKMGGSKGKAKLLISEYYRRVAGANKFFTSHKEGWKTDRGMVSIVFGMPNSIQKSKYSETWVYGNSHNMMLSLTFNFNKENAKILKNDFQLRRYRVFRNQWYRACESWRSGRAYNFN